MPRLSIEEILRGTSTGRIQSVGCMGVVPIIQGEDRPEDFAPPNVEAGTRNYGRVHVRNPADRPTIVPTAAGWCVRQAAQDHAIASAALMKAKEIRDIGGAMCVQQNQGGLIRQDAHKFVILPAGMRNVALAMRHQSRYDRLWPVLHSFNRHLGVSGYGGNLVSFLKHYQKELDEFVAEFELVPNQIGAVVLVMDRVVGVEVAPNVAYWSVVWEPLIRVCYGALAIDAARRTPEGYAPAYRTPLGIVGTDLNAIAEALNDANAAMSRKVTAAVDAALAEPLLCNETPDAQLESFQLLTAANQAFSGQIVKSGEAIRYASLCLC